MTDPGEGASSVALLPYDPGARPPLRIEWPTQPERPGEPVPLRDRWCFLAVFLISLLVFVSADPGRMFFDTKLGVNIDPAGFLARLWPLWDPLEWFGTLQNQYIGYAIPMAPFYLLGQLAHVPVWLTERLWLATLMTVGFAGLVRLARALEIGTDGTRLLGAAVYVLWPTYTIVIGSTSAAALPGLVLPWAILPLVGAVRGRPAWRAAALSGLAVAAMGGVNAASTGFALVLPALFIVIQASGRLRITLLAKWAAAVLAGTAWWLVPLLLQGRYSFNFLPYIEQSSTTFSTMSASAFLRGSGFWTAYLHIGTPWLPPGWSVVTEPAVILASATAAGAGLYGLARRDMPARRWLLAGAGLAAVVALSGYQGPLGSPLGGAAGALFNGALAPLRSTYKLEPILALALALGCAHAMSRWARAEFPLGAGRVPASAAIAPLAALVLAGLAVPQLSGQVLQSGSFSAVPGYWYQVASFLSANSPRTTALVVPADAHGQYLWGDPIDDPLEPLASSPWVERPLEPNGGAGSQVFLNTAEQAVESGQVVPGLPAYLARAGIRYIVVRNDLSPTIIGYTSPQIVNETLALSGFARVASFGPLIASSPGYPQAQPSPPGQPLSYPAVEVFQAVNPAWRPASPVTALPTASTVLVNGGPDSLLQLAGQGVLTSQPAVIAGDKLPVSPSMWDVTDGQRRADDSFGLTTQNLSYTYTATETNPPDDPLGGSGGPPRQILPVSAAGHQTVAVLSGAAQVTASSSGSWLVQEPQYDPVNAFDGNPATAWAEASPGTPAGQWIQVSFDHALDLPAMIGIQLLTDSPLRSVATQVRVSTAAGAVTTSLAGTGARQALRVPPGSTGWLRVTITRARVPLRSGPGAGFASVDIPGVTVTRYLQPAENLDGAQAASVAYSFHQQVASPAVASDPQASQVLARTFQVPAAQLLTVTAIAVPRGGQALERLINSLAPASRDTLRVTASSTWDSLPQYGPGNLFSSASFSSASFNSASGTPWVASASDASPSIQVSWRSARTIRDLVLTPASGVSTLPGWVKIAGKQGTQLDYVSPGGVVRLSPPVRASELDVTFPATSFGSAPVALSRITIPALAGLHVAGPNPRTEFRLACGQGPSVSIDGQAYQTAVSGTVADLMGLKPVTVRLCTPGGLLELGPGRQWLTAAPSGTFAMTDLDMGTWPDAGAAPQSATSGEQRSVRVVSWQDDERSVRVGAGAQAYVEIHENFNAGCEATLNGRPLTAVRLDGWQQAFIVPAGPGGLIKLRYAPATVYHAGLIAAAAALAVLAVVAIWPGRRRSRRRDARGAPGRQNGPRMRGRSWSIAGTVAVFALPAVVIWLVGGPVMIAVPVLAHLGSWRQRWLPWVAFGAMLIMGIVACTGSPATPGSGALSGLAQACALVALAAVLVPDAAGMVTPRADRQERVP